MQPQENLVEKAHEIEKSFDCSKCDGKFKAKKNLKKHSSEMHGKKFECSKCPKLSFEGKKHLMRHIKIVHEKKKLFQCPICPTKFGAKGNFNFEVET